MLGNAFNNSEAKTETILIVRIPIDLSPPYSKAGEDALDVFLSDSISCVDNLDGEKLRGSVVVYFDLDRAFVGVFERVVDQIYQYLLKPSLIAFDDPR